MEAATAEALADWIETSLLVASDGRFGLDKLYALAAAEVGADEARVVAAIDVMGKRASILGVLYPFTVNDVAVLTGPEFDLKSDYVALLFLTPGAPARQLVRKTETSEMGELFEEIAVRALANLWGPGGTALRFGHPSRIGRPPEFHLAVPWLAHQIGLELGSGYRPPRRKDGGVDVVAWRQFLDHRPGFPIALAQCTIQAETFTKTSDVDARLWSSWLAMDSDPLSLLVMPGTVRRAGPEWKQLSTVVMVIERLRLMELLGRGPFSPSGASGWVDDTLKSLRTAMVAGEG